MNEMATTELRSFLKQYKNAISIRENDTYKLVTISKKGTVDLREERKGVDIKADKAYRVKHGSFIYSRLAVHTGAFGLVPPELDGAIVSSEMPVFEIDKKNILPDYLIYLFSQNAFLNVLSQLTKGMGRVRIKEESFLKQRVTIHSSVCDQKKIVENIRSKFLEIDKLNVAQLEQAGHLKNLRQIVLEEAVKGELTAEWRKRNSGLVSGDNYASKLLEKHRCEKDRLVKEGKMRKEKPLPTITDTEKPFALPHSWAWCRLGEVGNSEAYPFVDGPFGSSINTKRDYIDKGIPVLRMLNIKPFTFIANNLKYVSEKKFESLKRHNVKSGDILFSKVGAGIGEACIVPDDFQIGMLATTGITRLRVGQVVLPKYLCYFLNVNRANFMALSSNTAQPFLNMTMIKMFKFPLPPVDEQKIIIELVDKIMAMIDELERQIADRKEKIELLIQLVLQEAFAEK